MKLLDLASDLLSTTPLKDVSVEPDTNNTVIFKALTLPPTHPFIRLPTRPFISMHPFTHPRTHSLSNHPLSPHTHIPFIHPSILPPTQPPTHLPTHPPTHLSIPHPSVYPPIHSPIFLSVHPLTYPSCFPFSLFPPSTHPSISPSFLLPFLHASLFSSHPSTHPSIPPTPALSVWPHLPGPLLRVEAAPCAQKAALLPSRVPS